MISPNDIVTVTLEGGRVIERATVVTVPGKNDIYWELETKEGQTVVFGPSVVLIRKIE